MTNMKNKILLIVTCITIILVFTGCKNNEEKNKILETNNTEIIEMALNENYDINKNIVELKSNNAILLEKSEILQKYNLGDNDNLETKVAIEKSETKYEEIAIVKLTSEEQTYNIQKAMLERVKALKEEYKTNSEITKILENSENIKIKVQDGIGVLIISKDAEEIMQVFDSTF